MKSTAEPKPMRSDILERCLEDLEQRIDPAEEDRLLEAWNGFTDGKFAGDIFSPRRSRPNPSGITWPVVLANAAIHDFEKMTLQQFGECSRHLAEGNGALMCVRCNYGSSILPSIFGVKMFFMEDGVNTLPTSEPVAGGRPAIRALIERGVPDLQAALGGQTLEMGARFAAIRKHYPRIAKYIPVYHPDVQGPIDICEVLWGSSLFIDIVDDPRLVKDFLELIVETYIRFMQAWYRLFPPSGDRAVHWSVMHRGQIMLRNDSAMNLSPEMFAEFVNPCDQRLWREFGGGALHFCGRGDHYLEHSLASGLVHAVAMSQPEYNDLEHIYRQTVDRGLKLLSFPRKAAEAALAAGRPLRGNVHCG